MGDALAIALLEAKGFSHEDFAFSHPGGHSVANFYLRSMTSCIPVSPSVCLGVMTVSEALEMTAKRLGFTTVLGDDGHLIGVFSDGDLRRAIETGHDLEIDKFAT